MIIYCLLCKFHNTCKYTNIIIIVYYVNDVYTHTHTPTQVFKMIPQDKYDVVLKRAKQAADAVS